MLSLFISFRTIDAVTVSGNRWTSTDYILKYAGVSVGDTLTDSLLVEVRRRLWQLGLFRGVDTRYDAGTLKIEVKEAWYVYPFPYVSVSTVEVAYGLGVQHINFRGRGETVYVLGTLGDRRILMAGWSTPTHRMVRDVFSVEGGKEFYRSQLYRMPIDRYFVNVRFRSRLENPWRLRIGILVSRVTSDSSDLLYRREGDRFLSTETYLYRDTRDWENYPRRGYEWRGGLRAYVGDFAAWVYGADWEGYYTVGKLTFVPYLSMRRVFGELPVYLKLPLVGTSEMVRGSYPASRMVGDVRTVVSLEVRYLTFERFPFVSHIVEGGAATVLFLDSGRLDTLSALIGGVGVMAYTPFGSFTGLVGYGTGGFHLFFGESRRIW